jgi:hypothetical protein
MYVANLRASGLLDLDGRTACRTVGFFPSGFVANIQ